MTPVPRSPVSRFAAPLVAVAVVAVGYGLARYPCLSPGDCAKLAAQFKFEKLPAHELPCRGAGWQPAVSPTGSRLDAELSRRCGLPIRDTADCQSALRFQGARLDKSSGWSLLELSDHSPCKPNRQVHPSLQRISAWISSLGVSVVMADLDGDGLPNDLGNVDPRTGHVTFHASSFTVQRFLHSE